MDLQDFDLKSLQLQSEQRSIHEAEITWQRNIYELQNQWASDL